MQLRIVAGCAGVARCICSLSPRECIRKDSALWREKSPCVVLQLACVCALARTTAFAFCVCVFVLAAGKIKDSAATAGPNSWHQSDG